MKKKLILALLVWSGLVWGQANGPAPQNQPPGQIPLLVGGQFNTTPAAIAPGNMTPLQLDSNGNLKINLQAGTISGAGTSATDTTSFTAAVSPFTPGGAVFNDTLVPLAPGVWATFRMTAFRALQINLRDSSGNEYNASNPLPVTATITSGATVGVNNTVSSNIASVGGTSLIGSGVPVVIVSPSPGLPLPPCNPVRVTACQHF